MDIYVGNLSFQLSEPELQDVFQEFGEVKSVKIVTDKATGKSKGFGFITMGSEEEAQRAIDNLNGRQLSGRNMVVNMARPKEENSYSSSGRSGNDRGGNRGGSGGYGGGGGRGRSDYGNDRRGGGGGHRDRDGGGYNRNNNWR